MGPARIFSTAWNGARGDINLNTKRFRGLLPMAYRDRIIFTRWASLGSCFLSASVAVPAYAFGIYSKSIGQSLKYTHHDLAFLASFGEAGLYLAVLCGVFMGFVGPRFTLLVGGIMILLGYQFLFQAATHQFSSTLTTVSLLLFVAQLGTSCVAVTTTAVTIKNFPLADRGKAAGLAKGYFGLSTAVLSQLYKDFFPEHSIDFLDFLSFYCPLVIFVGLVQTNVLHNSLLPYEYESKTGSSTSLFVWLLHLIIMLLYLLILGALEEHYTFSTHVKYILGTTTLVLQSSVALLHWYYGPALLDASQLSGPTSPKKNDSPVGKQFFIEADRNGTFVEGSLPSPTLDLNLWSAIKMPSFWVSFGLYFCGAGTGLIVINNIPQIAESMGTRESSYFVTLFGVFNCAGRALIGWFSDDISHHLPRPKLLCVVVFSIGITSFFFATGHPVVLYPGIMCIGFFFGGLFTLMAAFAGDVFGTDFVAENAGALDIAPALGAFFFATYIVDLFHTDECYRCFSKSFVVAGCMCTAASISGYVYFVQFPTDFSCLSIERKA